MTGPGDTPSRRRDLHLPAGVGRIGGARPPAPGSIVSDARAPRVRRPVTEPTSAPLLGFYQTGRARRAASTAASQLALRRILADSEFVFRAETEPARPAPGDRDRVSDLELASRLSFFLWSSIPDDELLTVGGSGTAQGPAPCSSGRCGGCWPIRGRRAARRQLRGPVALPAESAERASRAGRVPGLRRQPASGLPAGDRAAARERDARGPQRARSC